MLLDVHINFSASKFSTRKKSLANGSPRAYLRSHSTKHALNSPGHQASASCWSLECAKGSQTRSGARSLLERQTYEQITAQRDNCHRRFMKGFECSKHRGMTPREGPEALRAHAVNALGVYHPTAQMRCLYVLWRPYSLYWADKMIL